MATTRKKTRQTASSTDRTLAYAKAVIAGKIIAGPHVRNACQRHIHDLKRKDGIWFDRAAADHIFGFFEDVLKLSEGQFEGLPFQLEPSQCSILGSLFGWKRKDGTRRFRRAYIEQGKGNGKSPMAGGIGLFGMTADQEAGAQVYAAASKTDQAQVLFQDACKMVRAAPALFSRLQFSGGVGREFNIAHLKSGSYFRPVSREAGKSGSGPRPHIVLADEIHEMPDGKILEMLERGFKFRRQPLLLMITNSGSNRNSICWEQHEHAIRVAAGNATATDDDPHYLGEQIDDTTFSYVCALDKGDDPLNDPSCWVKANPLLNVTINDEYLAGVVKQAKQLPSMLNGILRLHFCVWTDAETAWMTRALLEPCLAEFDPAEHYGKTIFNGIDLSQTKDITAKASACQIGVVEEGEHEGKPLFDVWVEAWTPGDTLQERATRDKQPYDVWFQQGFLSAPKGATISFRHVAQALAEDDHNYDLAATAYDRYAFRRGLEPECDELGLSLEFVEHPQGGVKKGKPTEAMIEAAEEAGREPEGLWMPASVRQFEELVLERRVRIRINPVVISAIMSAVTAEDRWGNYWLAKERAVNKIDCAVAICMAIGAALAHQGTSYSLDDWIASYAA